MEKPLDIDEKIFIHTEVPEVKGLLVGSTPSVFSARNITKKIVIKEPEEPKKDNPRFAPIRTSMSISDSLASKALTPRPHYQGLGNDHFQKTLFLEKTHEFVDDMNNKLVLYDNAYRMKKYVYQEDYEEHYRIPLFNRLREKLTGDSYDEFSRRKEENIRAMDLNPVSIGSNKEPMKLKEIELSTSGLRDPADKFKEKKDKDRNMQIYLAKVGNKPLPPEKPPARMTLDFKKFGFMSKCRCWQGTGVGAVGKRSFVGKSMDTVKFLVPTFPDVI